MALINCSECGAEVSDRAVACPKCGGPISVETTPARPVGRRRRGIGHAALAGRGLPSVATDKVKITILRGKSPNHLVTIGIGMAVLAIFMSLDEVVTLPSPVRFIVIAGVAFFTFSKVFGGPASRNFNCEYCGHVNSVDVDEPNHECRKCRVLHIIDWE